MINKQKIIETIYYLLNNTEDFLDKYNVPTEKEIIKAKISYNNPPEDYIDYLKRYGQICGPLYIWGIYKIKNISGVSYPSVKITEEKITHYKLGNILVVREDGFGNFDFIDLDKSSKDKSEVYFFDHETLSVNNLNHRDFLSYTLYHMLMFLEDEFEEEEYNELTAILEAYENYL